MTKVPVPLWSGIGITENGHYLWWIHVTKAFLATLISHPDQKKKTLLMGGHVTKSPHFFQPTQVNMLLWVWSSMCLNVTELVFDPGMSYGTERQIGQL